MSEKKFEMHEVVDKIVINYRYSTGGQSAFFIELMNNKKIHGTKCKKCGKVWMPPRINCSDCYADTDWVALKPEGEIMISTIAWFTTSAFIASVPYAMGFIKMEGADTGMLQGIFSENLVPSKIKKGKKVKAVFNKSREGKMTDFFFVPEEEYENWIAKPEFEGGG
jgi:uncharacterized OB-fold protein